MYLSSETIQRLTKNLQVDLTAFAPEALLCLGLVVLLGLRLAFRDWQRRHLGWVALLFCILALVVAADEWPQCHGILLGFTPNSLNSTSRAQEIFTSDGSAGGLLVFDNLTVFMRLFLLSFTALVIWLSMLSRIPDSEDSGDFYVLLLGATIGMSLMASANHLLMVFIGVEMASLPSYALAGFLKGKRQASEAALKYVVYGGGAAGIMLYGISLLAGKFGTGYLPDVAAGFLATLVPGKGLDPVVLLGTLFILVGFAFKLSAVPFHFWCPDVFEGAAAEVAAFLSVASKGAALALFGRFTLVLAGLARGMPVAADHAAWFEVASFLTPGIAFFAALTATFGNLAAYAQTNLKRLLAYSTIAHAGYMMMGLAALSPEGAAAVLFYLVAYLFMNLGAFAIVAFLRNLTGTEDLSGYRGLVLRAPFLTVLLGVFLLSLLGLPPLAGFAAKFQIFAVLFNAGRTYSAMPGGAGLGYTMYALLAIGGINTAISALYYLKVLKVMTIERSAEQLEGEPVEPLPLPAGPALFTAFLGVMVFVVGVAWNPLATASDVGANRFNHVPQPGEMAKR